MYAFNVRLMTDFDSALERLTAALTGEKMGIVSEVNVQAVMQAKLGKSIPPYRILGACAPALADRVISAQPDAGTLLPCNVVVREESDGSVVISFMDPVSVLGLANDAEVDAAAAEANEKIERVIEALKQG